MHKISQYREIHSFFHVKEFSKISIFMWKLKEQAQIIKHNQSFPSSVTLA